MRTHQFSHEMHVARPLNEVFAFFADASNLERLTPPWLHFKVLTPKPITMRVGTKIDYKLTVHGLPLRWQSAITVWDAPHRFVDVQLKGPYRQWVHEHRFEESKGGTQVIDLVQYAVPGGRLMNRLFVRRDITRIFAYREEALTALFTD